MEEEMSGEVDGTRPWRIQVFILRAFETNEPLKGLKHGGHGYLLSPSWFSVLTLACFSHYPWTRPGV